MDSETRIFIIEELTAFLNRAPSEQEIQNAVTDINITNKVQERKRTSEAARLNEKVAALETKQTEFEVSLDSAITKPI